MKKARVFVTIVTTLLALTGCGPTKKPLLICPGKNSSAEALTTLKSQSKNMVSLYAKGKCRLQYYDDKEKKRKENLDVKLLVKSPAEIYFQGDLSIVPKAVILGSNETEFWLALRPKEISTYWSGRWSELESSKDLLINPKTLLEALGIAEIDTRADWSLSNEGPFDILTKHKGGIDIQKTYIYCCDYTIRKIEYFDLDGRALANAELDKYKNISENFSVPSRIKITTFGRSKTDSISITLDLGSIQHQQFTEKQASFFKPYPMEGFKHIYRLVDGQWVEQLQ
jgi:hypothetical protein